MKVNRYIKLNYVELDPSGRWVGEMVESDVALFSEVLFGQAIMTKIKETGNLTQLNDFLYFIVQKCQESINV